MDRIPLGWRLFLFTALVFGPAMGLYQWWLGADPAMAGASGAMAGVLFGGLMAVTLGTMQVLGSSSMGSKPWNPLVSPERTVEVAVPPAKALAAARAALQARGIARVVEEREDRLVVRTSLNLWSVGEIVTVVAKPAGAGSVVALASKPALWTTLVDYGVNAQNLDRIAEAFARLPVERQRTAHRARELTREP